MLFVAAEMLVAAIVLTCEEVAVTGRPVAVLIRCNAAGLLLSATQICAGLAGSYAIDRISPTPACSSFIVSGAEVPPDVVVVTVPNPCTGSAGK